jgi:hypothetical protein
MNVEGRLHGFLGRPDITPVGFISVETTGRADLCISSQVYKISWQDFKQL